MPILYRPGGTEGRRHIATLQLPTFKQRCVKSRVLFFFFTIYLLRGKIRSFPFSKNYLEYMWIISWIFEGRKRRWELQLSISRDIYQWSNREFIVLVQTSSTTVAEEALSRWAFQEIARNLYAFELRLADKREKKKKRGNLDSSDVYRRCMCL